MTLTTLLRTRPFAHDQDWRDVIVIGGGASGVLFAANLLRQNTDLRVTVVEGQHMLGCGIAYSTTDPDHLLNTRVHNMSAFPDDEDHFLNWLSGQTDGASYTRDSFVSRCTYGRYLSGLLEPWAASGRLVCLAANCIGLRERDGGVKVDLDDGREIQGAYAVLATGHVVPKADPNGLITGAWDALPPPPTDSTVVIIGTGLSMVDQVLSLERSGHRGPIVAVSRRGVLPRTHAPATAMPVAQSDVPLGAPVSQILHWLRRLARQALAQGGTWRDAVDGIRPWVSAIWQHMTTDQRARFLRHGATWWEVHRHRIPPASADKLATALNSGQMRVMRAAFLRAEQAPVGGTLAVVLPRGQTRETRIGAGRIIDCRGIRNDPERNASPLMADLLATGAARVDPLHIGLEVSDTGQLIDQQGRMSPRLFAMGPVSRATFWEITAIPDIRVQARTMARTIAALEHANRA